MTKRKSKGKRGSTADFEFGEWPFFGGDPSADAEDSARYRWVTSPECDYGFIADLRGATKEQWDVEIDGTIEKLKAAT